MAGPFPIIANPVHHEDNALNTWFNFKRLADAITRNRSPACSQDFDKGIAPCFMLGMVHWRELDDGKMAATVQGPVDEVAGRFEISAIGFIHDVVFCAKHLDGGG